MTLDSNPSLEAPPAVAPEFAPGRILANRYRVDRLLGGGGMGVILAGWHMELGQRVAIKALRPEGLADPATVARFMREARALARLKSEHVARVIDVGKEGAHPFMVMEYLRGSDLSVLQKQERRFSVADAVTYVLQAGEGIAEAHRVGIVHRDIKPANLFLTKRADGSPLIKVLDFGISKLVDPTTLLSPDEPLTKTAMMMGSPHYMPPEQLKDARDVDARADIWSLGVVLYRLLSGAHAFTAESSAELCVAILVGQHVPLRKRISDMPEGLSEVIDKCLQKDIAARFQTVGELATALEPFAPAAAKLSIGRITSIAASPHADSLPPPALPSENLPAMALENATVSVDVQVDPGTKVTSLTSTESLRNSAGIPKRTGMLAGVGAILVLAVVGAMILPRVLSRPAPAIAAAPLPPPKVVDSIPPPPPAQDTTASSASPLPSASVALSPSPSASIARPSVLTQRHPGASPHAGAPVDAHKPTTADGPHAIPSAAAPTPPPPPAAPVDPTGFGGRK